MAFYCVRKKILSIEKDFLEDGKLKCKDDIFFLNSNEIDSLQKGKLVWMNVEDRIRKRRLEHVQLSKMTPPKTIGIGVAQKPKPEGADEGGALLYGMSASPGSYEGVAHLILNPSVDIELKPGEILVAPYTDPAWTPLFLIAGAAVVEVGSYLSHAGTIAREYGMPCVVDLPDFTKRIHTGARIMVDGYTGVVKILSPNPGEQ